MAEFQSALEDALSGRGQLVMLAGEPGIGKTRLAQEVASRATVLGFRVLWGWCYEAEGAPPHWPWVQPIRSYLQQRDPEQLRSEMGPGAADIAEVIPELRGKLPDLKPPPALEPEQARFRLFDSITTFLKNAAQSQPLMLVLDDLHWADQSSLLLLQFLARQLGGSRLLVVGCYRDVELSRQHPLSEALAQLTREPVFQRKPLRGLSQEDTGRFIEAIGGIQLPQRLGETIYAHTEGNPFFMTEVVRLLAERGELATGEIGGPQGMQGIRIPEGVREVIGQRLNRLSEQCNQTLTTASIIGREFDFKLLKALSSGVTDDQLLQVVDEALSAHLIEELPGAGERYQFTHALIQQTLVEELSTSRRVRLHARIGETLEEMYGADAEAHAAELAHHFAEAESVLGTEKLVKYSLLAGEKALATYAWEEAQAHFQRGLSARGVPLEGTEPAADAETAALLFGLARAQAAKLEMHQVQGIVASLGRALDYYAEAGDVDRVVAVAEYPVGADLGLATGAGELISRALRLVPPDSHQAGRLLSTYGLTLYQDTGDYGGAQETFNRALAIAQREKDPALEMRTLANAANVHFYHLRPQEVLEKGLRAIELARHANDPRTEVLVRSHMVRTLDLMGDYEGAERHAGAMLAVAERLPAPSWTVA
jgi:tetratricopeptide (TPR) repeat protein